MSNGADLKGRLDLDISGATNSLKAAQKAFRDLSTASTDAGKQMTQSQRAAANAVIANYEKVRKAQSKVVESAIETERKWTEAERKGRSDRANNAKKTAASVGLTNATTEYTQTKTNGLATMVPLQADNLLAKTAKIDGSAANAVELKNSALLTAELRRQIALRDEGARRAVEGAKQELALRKQVFREQQVLNRAQQEGVVGLNGMRYVLADVGQAMRTFGIAALAIPLAAAATSIAWEREFANVIRTTGVTGDAVDNLKGQFVSLVQTMPVSFEKLAEIGALAGQLGVLEPQVGRFTKTVAMFSATTDVSVSDSATAFGRLNSLLPDVQGNFTGLGDSILKVGVNSVATEGQIIKISTQIAAIVGPAGYAADQVIGLSGALASVGVPPELSRGVITRVFGQINKATINGGASLEKWGRTMGMSGEQFRNSWNTDAAGTFQNLMGVLNDSGSSAALVLNNLGITSVRDVPILMRLAGALDANGKAFNSATGEGGLLVQTMKDAANAAGEMQKQYDIIGGTTAAKMQVFVQSLQALIDAVGSNALPAFGDILDSWTDSLHDLTRSLDEPVRLFGLFELPFTNGEAMGFTAIAIAIIGALALMVAAITRVVQAAIALHIGMKSLPGDMAALGFASVKTAAQVDAAALATGQFGAKAGLATRAASGFRGALSLIGGSGVMAVLIGLPIIIDTLNKSFENVGSSAKDMSHNIIDAKDAFELLENTQIGKGGTGNPWQSMSAGAKDFGKQLELLDAKSQGAWNMDTRRFEQMRQGTATIDKLNSGYEELIAAGNQEVVFSSVQGLTKDLDLSDEAIRRLVYNTPALNTLFKDTLSANGIKPTEDALITLSREGLGGFGIAAEDAAVAGAAFNEEISAAEQAVADFIAGAAGGDAAFISITGAMDNVNAKNKELAQGTADATESSDDSWEDYVGNFTFNVSDYLAELESMVAAQTNWEANMSSLVGKVSNETLTKLAEMGPEAAPLVAAITTMTQPELDRFEAAFAQSGTEATTGFAAGLQAQSDLIAATGASLGTRAKNELIAKLGAAGADIDLIMYDYKRRIEANKPNIDVNTSLAEQKLTTFREQQQLRGFNIPITYKPTNPGVLGPAHPNPTGKTAAGVLPFTGGYMFDRGGYTGDGGMYQPAGIVHKGEFVMTKQATSALGQGYLYNLMRSASKGYATGGTVTGSSNSYVQSFGGSNSRANRASASQSRIVELSPYDRALLKANGNIGLSIDGREISNTANNGSLSANRRGSN